MSAKLSKENGLEPKLSTLEEKEPVESSLSTPLPNILMLVAMMVLTLSTIIAGYFHGKMNIGAVWHNLHNFS